MARSLYSALMQGVRAAERAQRQSLQAERRRLREVEMQQRQQRRLALATDRDAQRAYLAERESEVAAMNHDLESKIDELRGVMLLAPEFAEPVKFQSLKKRFVPGSFEPEAVIGQRPNPPSQREFHTTVKKPSFLAGLFGGNKKYLTAVNEARRRDEAAYQQAHVKHVEQLQAWNRESEVGKRLFADREAKRKLEIQEHNDSIDSFQRSYEAGDQQAVLDYFSLVLERSVLPEGFPEDHRLAYIKESNQIVLEHDLPTVDVIPVVAEFTYVKTKDEIREKARKRTEIRDLYKHVIASTCLRLINEIYASDYAAVVQSVVLNGIVESIAPATGEIVRPCVVSVRTTRGDFASVSLERVDPIACLTSFGAVSKKPEELAPIRPVIEFDMVDARFVDESDIMSSLDSRPNVMDLTPAEFEGLVANLFSGMGLDTRQTRSSRDGGVDAVAFDPRPVLGGKVVIQAKRYRHTVGVSAVRDLYGTMMNEGANKGILVTTSGYGPDAFKFAHDKPIELLDGHALLHLLAEQGMPAKIIMPEPE